jgi:hypothetical protein
MSRHYERQKERQKTPQPGQEQPDIVAGAYEDGVDRVASGSGQMVSLKKAFTLGVTDNWFDGAASSQFSLDGRASFDRALRHMNIRRFDAVAASLCRHKRG